MNKQQKQDYYYGYILRLADELSEFDDYIDWDSKMPNSLDDKIAMAETMEERILENADSPASGRLWNRGKAEQLLNPPL